jgi:uracil-DNA glycosylase family 4
VSDKPSSLADVLAYLGEIGYGDLYLGPEAAAALASPASSLVPGGLGGAGEAAGTPEPAEPHPSHSSEAALRAPLAGGGAAGLAEREAELARLQAAVARCTRCRLCDGRNQTVFGSGRAGAELMFIGEGPGAEEDRQGLPFVGRAGELLTRIIQAIDRRRDEVYIANIVKCRPPGNRDPQPDEVSACRSYLERQIELVQPKAIVALGRIAAQTLLGNDSPIGRMRGQWFRVLGVPTMVTYHPAALLRNPALKRATWEDMQQVRDRLAGR